MNVDVEWHKQRVFLVAGDSVVRIDNWRGGAGLALLVRVVWFIRGVAKCLFFL